MAGELWRQKVQVGKETVYGTAVPATRIVYTRDPVLTREREPREHRFATGTRDNVRARTLGAVAAGGSFTVPMSADELLEWLLCAVQGNVSPTTPSGFTNGRQWQFRPSATLDSMTIEWDDGANVYEEYGVYVDEIAISGSVGGENTVTFTVFGKERVSSTLTGSLSDRTPTFIEGWETKLFIDAAAATPGTTQIGGTLINWSITIRNGLGRKYTGENTLAASKVTIGELVVEATLTFEADQSAVDTELANWDAETARVVRLSFGNNEVIDVGTNEVQTLTEGTALTAGTFTLSFRGQTTSALNFNATAAQVQAALEALTAIGSGNVACTGGSLETAPITITFQGQLAGQDVPQLTSNQAGLTGTFTHATTTPGTGSRRAVHVDIPGHWTAVDIGGEDEGTRTYEFSLGATYDTSLTFALQILCWTSRTAAWT